MQRVSYLLVCCMGLCNALSKVWVRQKSVGELVVQQV